MQYRLMGALAALLAGTPAGPGSAARLRGAVDVLDAGHTVGWACVSDGSAPARVAVLAGDQVVGIYPTKLRRPDLGVRCPGSGAHGFSVAFDRSARALFVGQTRLAVFATATGTSPRLLPAKSSRTHNPLILPQGALRGLSAGGRVRGTVADGGGAPLVRLFAGGPPGVGVAGERVAARLGRHGKYKFDLALPGAGVTPGPGVVLPVFATAFDPRGVAVPLGNPLPLIPLSGGGGQIAVSVPMRALVAQQGPVSGVRNTLFTAWLPAGTGFAGVSGALSLTGSDASFSEALVELGTTGDGPANCAAENGAEPANPPTLSRLWAGILKSNGTNAVRTPVNFALPYAVPGAAAGTCLMAWISAGYPYLSQGVARYTTTQARLDVTAVPTPTGSQRVVPFGVGGEFRFPGTTRAPQGVYVGIEADRALNVDGIAGSASAAPVAGAPSGSGWLPAPMGGWSVSNSFYYVPQAICAAAHFNAQPSIGILSVLRDGKPGTLTVPSGAVQVMSLPIASQDDQAIQQAAYQAFAADAPPGRFTGALAVGDCLVSYNMVRTDAGGAPGVLDVENQSTVFLRVLP